MVSRSAKTWMQRTYKHPLFRQLSAISDDSHKPHAHSTMAQMSITEDAIKAALTERLKATHVEVQDMSGMARTLCNLSTDVIPEPCRRLLRPQPLTSL
jgi:stress-induced morphogen